MTSEEELFIERKDKQQSFFRTNYLLIIWAFLVTLCTYWPKISEISYSIDTERFIADPKGTLEWWLSLNRYGLVFLKNILPFEGLPNPQLTSIATYFLLFTSSILLSWLFMRQRPIKNRFSLYGGVFLYLTSPTIIEQTNFILQSAEVVFAINLLYIAVILLQKYSEKRNLFYFILSILLSSFSFSVYQSLQVAFVVLAIVSVYFKAENNQTIKEYFSNAFPYICSLAISYGLYYAANQWIYDAFHVQKNSYITDAFDFSKYTPEEYFENVSEAVVDNFFQMTTFCFEFIPILLGFFLLTFLLNKRNRGAKKVSLMLSTVILILAILFLVLTMGHIGPIRSYVPTVSIVLYFLVLAISHELRRQPILIYTLVLLSFIGGGFQFTNTYRLEESANRIYRKEIKVAENIKAAVREKGIDQTQNYRLAVYDSLDDSDDVLIEGDMIGQSFFDFDRVSQVGVSQRTADFLTAQGMPIKAIKDREKYVELASIAGFLEDYPEKGYLTVSGDYIIIKFPSRNTY